MATSDELFSDLVSENYVNAFYSGRLSEVAHKEPYEFAYLYDFWKPAFYNQLSKYKSSLKAHYIPEGETQLGIYFEPFDYEPFIELVYSNTFRTFLANLVGRSTYLRPQECYPQLRALKSGTSGLLIHNDADAPYNGVAFFNINDGWKEGDGGELVVWQKITDSEYKKCFEFAPLGNSLSVILLGHDSYHSVNRLNGHWVRSNILVETQFKE